MAIGTISTGLLAGCLGDELTEANPEGDNESDSNADDEDEFDGVEPEHGDGFLEGTYSVDGGEITVKQIGFESGSWWDEGRDGSYYPSRVELFATEDAVLDFIDFDAIHTETNPDHSDTVQSFVEDTTSRQNDCCSLPRAGRITNTRRS